ncbi:hypothetical protein [Azospirillum canadense]|uniref:hypothetical protein n=1 Tax=Azospirillum canadense TaxID=403962 RepID=UPI002227B873|nr:hypothetical protein [Azospirillum canadense]MCW2242507.1 hypothetical protein [Azospirillum canadense]
MNLFKMTLPLFATVLTFASLGAFAQSHSAAHMAPKTDGEMIANAMSAAPRAVAETATIIAMNEKGEARTLRQGTGNFTCMPDNPMTPGNDPMCLDKNAMEWAKAWIEHKEPPKGQIGLAYMLAGGSDASNNDPYATAPPPGHTWVDTGPHVMILNAVDLLQGYPTTAENARAPYVMWGGTPYAHIMMPVSESIEQAAETPAKP